MPIGSRDYHRVEDKKRLIAAESGVAIGYSALSCLLWAVICNQLKICPPEARQIFNQLIYSVECEELS